MEEEDGLDMEHSTLSRLVTPSPSTLPMGHEVNKTPKAKSRTQPPQPTYPHDIMDEDYSNMGGYQDMEMNSEEELISDHINMKLEDMLEELKEAKQSPIWKKLDFIELWVDHCANLIGSPRGSKMDKHIITDLAETNGYLTKKIVELELKDINFAPKTVQSQPPQEQPLARKMAPSLTQPSWAQVATTAHKRSPTLPPKPGPTKQCPNSQEKMADPQCLIIQISPPILATDRPNGIDM